MSDTSLLTAAAGVSTFLGLLGLLAYLYYDKDVRTAKGTIADIIGDKTSFTPKDVVAVLEKFTSEEARLQALEKLTSYGKSGAKLLYSRISERIGVVGLIKLQNSHRRQIAAGTGIFFFALAILALVFSLSKPAKSDPASSAGSQSSTGANSPNIANVQGNVTVNVGGSGATTKRGNPIQMYEQAVKAPLDSFQNILASAIYQRDPEALSILSRNENAGKAFTSGSAELRLRSQFIQKLAEFPEDWHKTIQLLPAFGWSPQQTAPFLMAYGPHLWPKGLPKGPETLNAMAKNSGRDIRLVANPRGSTSPKDNDIDPRTFEISPLLVAVWANDSELARQLLLLGADPEQALAVKTFPIWSNGKEGAAQVALRYSALSEAKRLQLDQMSSTFADRLRNPTAAAQPKPGDAPQIKR